MGDFAIAMNKETCSPVIRKMKRKSYKTKINLSDSHSSYIPTDGTFMNPKIQIVSIKGKGRGYIAVEDIEEGTLLMEEYPFLEGTLSEIYDKIAPLNGVDFWPLKIAPHLSKNKKENKPLSLAEYLLLIAKTDAFCTGSGEEEQKHKIVIFKWISLFNHHFVPNTMFDRFYGTWKEGEKRKLYACKFIPKGTEITLSYYDLLFSDRESRERILTEHGIVETEEDYMRELPSLLHSINLSNDSIKEMSYWHILFQSQGDIEKEIKQFKQLEKHFGNSLYGLHMHYQHYLCELIWTWLIYCNIKHTFEDLNQKEIWTFYRYSKFLYSAFHVLIENAQKILSPLDAYFGFWARRFQVYEQFFLFKKDSSLMQLHLKEFLDMSKKLLPNYNFLCKIFKAELRDFHLHVELQK